MFQSAIALNRFGLGARPGEQVTGDAQRWLVAQFDRFEPSPNAWLGIRDLSMRTVSPQARAELRQSAYLTTTACRLRSAMTASAPFVERLVHFWANHFAVSVEKGNVTLTAGLMERDAIRAHVLGRFEDMLVAVEQHPAMMAFLDQNISLGPHSPAALAAARNGKQRGLNENLAREIMELHTLGVRSGYTQTDVSIDRLECSAWRFYVPSTYPRTRSKNDFRQALSSRGSAAGTGRFTGSGAPSCYGHVDCYQAGASLCGRRSAGCRGSTGRQRISQ